MQILVIDDSDTMRSVLRAELAELGQSDVIEATDGEAGLEIALKQEPDLILVELHMPRLDGLGFIEQFRESDRHTPVVLTLYRHELERIILAQIDGITDYLLKPITTAALSSTIHRSTNRAAG